MTDQHSANDGSQKTLKTVHIDTSLQIERCKAKNKSEIVEQALRSIPFKATSSYAKLEFREAWLKDLAYLYAQSENLGRTDKLIGRINDRLNAHPLNRRRVSRCLQAIEKFLGEVPDHIPYGAALSRFRAHLRVAILGAYTWWDSSVTHEFDGTGCARAKRKPTSRYGKIDVSCPRCLPTQVECTIIEFLESTKEHLLSISKVIDARGDASDELKDAKAVIDLACNDPQVLCDSRNCRKLGDILIALDGLKMDCYAANNDKEWQLLAEVLEKPLINPVRDAKETAST